MLVSDMYMYMYIDCMLHVYVYVYMYMYCSADASISFPFTCTVHALSLSYFLSLSLFLFLLLSLPPSLSSSLLALSLSILYLLSLSLFSSQDTCTLKSKFEVSSGPTSPTPALVHFMCDGSTLSGVAMAIESSAYKISLQKNKCFSGTDIIIVSLVLLFIEAFATINSNLLV